MSEKGNLYKTISVRFSLVNEQHVRCLQKIEKQGKMAGKSRSQIVIKALEDYFGKTDDDGAGQVSAAKNEIEQYAKDIKEKLKSEIRQGLMTELLGVVSGISLRGMADAVPAADTPMTGKEDLAELEDNAGIVESAMKWG